VLAKVILRGGQVVGEKKKSRQINKLKMRPTGLFWSWPSIEG
jgi:hypothetical protein